jgi:hypothetical protein
VTRRRRVDLPLAIVLAATGILALLAVHTTPDDAFWQITYGDTILQRLALPARDVYSWTVAGRPLVVTEWLYDAVLAGAVHLGGWAVWLLTFGLLAATAGTAFTLFSAQSRSRAKGALLALVLLLVVAPFSSPLPALASFALWTAAWALLERARLRGPRILWLLPVLAALWANVHGTFLLAPGLALADTLITRLPRLPGRVRRPWHRGTRRALPLVTVVTAAATLVTPYGPRLFDRVFSLGTSSFHLAHIAEFQSPDFHTLYAGLIVLPFALFALAAPLVSGRALPARPLGLSLLFLAGLLWAVRLAPYAALPLGLLAATGLAGRRAPALRVPWPVIGLALAIPVILGFRRPPPAWPVTTGWPVGGASYVAAHLKGRGFNTYAEGSYLLWRWRGAPRVYIDSRGDLYMGSGVLSRYVALTTIQINPGATLAAEGVQWALLPRHRSIGRVLQWEGWRAVYHGTNSVVLVAPHSSALASASIGSVAVEPSAGVH